MNKQKKRITKIILATACAAMLLGACTPPGAPGAAAAATTTATRGVMEQSIEATGSIVADSEAWTRPICNGV